MLKFENKLKSIAFQNTNGMSYVFKSPVKNFLLFLLKSEKKISSIKTYITFIFISKKEMTRMNREFMSHAYPTDILTFNLSEHANELMAEIYICSDVVKENAKRFGVTKKNEFLRVMVHGILHLAGYKDKTRKEKKQMREREDVYLRLLGKVD